MREYSGVTGPIARAEMYAAHVRATYGTVQVGPVTGMAVMLTHGRTGIVRRRKPTTGPVERS